MHGNVAHLLLDVTNVVIVGCIHRKSIFLKLGKKLISDILASNLDLLHGMGQSVSLENRHGVSNTFAGLSNETRSEARTEHG